MWPVRVRQIEPEGSPPATRVSGRRAPSARADTSQEVPMACHAQVAFEGHQQPLESSAITSEVRYFLFLHTKKGDPSYQARFTWSSDDGRPGWRLSFEPPMPSIDVALLGLALAPLFAPDVIR
jgi:hypothetical protein